jgi:hypothetical protein
VAVSANATLDFGRDTIIQMAFQLAGVLGAGKLPSADDTAMAANFMNLELAALQAEGVILRTVERTTLALVAGTASYVLPADTIDVQLGPNDQAGSVVAATGSENTISTMSRADYMGMGATSGTPTSVYVEKQAVTTLIFWPTPDTSVTSFKYARVRLLKDMDTGVVTADLARRWLKYIAFAVAAHVARAKSLPLDNVASLGKEAQALKNICKADDNQRGKVRFRLDHPGKNWA